MKEISWKTLIENQGGATAIEFALVMPTFLTLIVGVINLSLFCMTSASLQYSVEEGARCASVRQTCPEPKSRYFAPGPAPVFTSSNAACGYLLSAKVTFNLDAILYRRSIPLSATACYP
jgi:Flp pilus assembly pilin Flp